MTRKMATIRKIEEVKTIPNADKIVAYRVGGWWVVDSIGKYIVGDLVVYAEPDSFIPTAIAPFLTKPGQAPKQFEGVEGERLRTVKLRGQLSQGLLLPMDIIPQSLGVTYYPPDSYQEGTDVSTQLGIVKYEAPIPAQLAGEVKGMFPSFIPKTDQERIQNLTAELAEWQKNNYTFEVTEKLDGSSMTVYLRDGEFGVCSRNLDLKRNEDNSLWKAALKNDLEAKLTTNKRNLALQGELIGEGIQGNKYKLRGQMFYIFDIYDIDRGAYLTPTARKMFVETYKLNHVPVFKSAASLEGLTVEQLLKGAEGKSVMGDITGPEQEGLVYKCNEAEVSFKCISNKFLLKNGD